MSPCERCDGVVMCDECGRRYDSWVNGHCPVCGSEERR